MPITLNGDTGIVTPMYNGSITANAVTPSVNMKNRIINGAMVIDQRNAGASVTPANAAYTLDRWRASSTQSSKYSIQQNAGSVTPPAGFVNYLGVTSLSAYSVGTSDTFGIIQLLEGFNVADLNFGSANAKTVTLSFWVRSSLTGTFGGALNNGAFDRSYPFTYTISSANTWEQKSVTIAGDTTGTWGTTNGASMGVIFGLGSGSTFSATAGSWTAGNILSATGATSVVGTNGATFYITGVQLEVGSTATSFDYRPYGTELALCQRYYYQLNANTSVGVAAAYSSGNNFVLYKNPVSMRGSATVADNSASGILAGAAATPSWSTVTLGTYASTEVTAMTFDGSTTSGYAYDVRLTSGSIGVSAEL